MKFINADFLKNDIKCENRNYLHKTLVECIIDDQPIAIVYCKNCKHRPIDNRTKEHPSNFNIEFPDGKCPCQCDDGWYSWYPSDDWFCGNGEAKDE